MFPQFRNNLSKSRTFLKIDVMVGRTRVQFPFNRGWGLNSTLAVVSFSYPRPSDKAKAATNQKKANDHSITCYWRHQGFSQGHGPALISLLCQIKPPQAPRAAAYFHIES